MPRLSKAFVDGVAIPSAIEGKAVQVFHRDSVIPGFGLRVTSGGSKAFIVERRINGKVKRKTLGKYGALTVEQARKEAQKFIGQVAAGQDPIAERRAEITSRLTLEDAFTDYLLTRKDLRPTTVHDYRRHIDGSFADWRRTRMTAITKDMVERRHRELGKRSQARANGAMRVLRAVFNHAINKFENAKGESILRINPVDRLNQNRAWYPSVRRQTLIKPHQLAAWYQGVMQLRSEVTQDYLVFLLLTGLRRSEAARLSWDDIDWVDRTLVCPVTKNGRAHTLPLSAPVLELLGRRRELTKGDWVFPSPVSGGHLTEPRSAVDRVCEYSGVFFRLHDLRRTFITIAESLDISAYAVKRLVNHQMSQDVTAGYIITDVERLRQPMARISAFMVERFTQEVSA